jgi:hypothetical protein
MKRVSIWVGVALFLTAAKASVAGDAAALDKVEYFPLKVGTTWEYVAKDKRVVVKVGGHEKIGNTMTARLETTADGTLVTEHLVVRPDGIYRVLANGQEIKPAFLVFKLPPRNGEKWSIECRSQNIPITGKMNCSQANKLKVGEKEYDTFLVMSSGMKIAGQDVEMKAWFNKEVGMVKQVFKQPGIDLDLTLELDKFTPGK